MWTGWMPPAQQGLEDRSWPPSGPGEAGMQPTPSEWALGRDACRPDLVPEVGPAGHRRGLTWALWPPQPLAPEVLSELKGKAVLEVEVSALAQRIQVLLGKLSQVLSLSSAAQLQAFAAAPQEMFVGDRWVTAPSLLPLKPNARGADWGNSLR